MHRRTLFGLCLVSLALPSCAPSVSPLYRDYDVVPEALAAEALAAEALAAERAEQVTDTQASAARGSDARDSATREVYVRLRAALAEAGWTEALAAAPNAVSTEARQFGTWGLWRVLVSLDAVPVGDRHVRVLFHPVRRYVTGGRSKIPYLGSGLRRALLPELNEALEAHGFVPIGTPRERDEEQTEGT